MCYACLTRFGTDRAPERIPLGVDLPAVGPRAQAGNNDEVLEKLSAEKQQRTGRAQRSIRYRDGQEPRVPYALHQQSAPTPEEAGRLQGRAAAGAGSARSGHQRLEQSGCGTEV